MNNLQKLINFYHLFMFVSALRSHKFLVIYVSQYIHTNTGDIHPAEIAICKFSFENGVDEIYHAIILGKYD